MRFGLACLAVTATVIGGLWAWLGAPIAMPSAPLSPGEKLNCVSYSPFRNSQTPLEPNITIPPAQIESDLAQLAKITECIRTYSVDFGQDKIPSIAAKLGLKVWQGIWLSSRLEKNRAEIATVIRLAQEYPDTIQAVVVGNEVLLRGEMSATDLAATIRMVKSQVKVPVTYADVWEFWLRQPDLADATDFVTIHILPYWEDLPIPAKDAAAHVDTIRRRVMKAFPNRQVLIGEVGWPSAGRMREAALPSRANQARVIHDVLALAKREGFKLNVIEAFDEPWKRALEGSVGGHWGLIDDASREFKFAWGEAISNHPHWKSQALGGIGFAVVVFAAAFFARQKEISIGSWLAVSASALAGGVLIGWVIENVPIESWGIAGSLRSFALGMIAVLSAPIFSIAIVRGVPAPYLSQLIGPVKGRTHDPFVFLLGAIIMATILLTIGVALGLVFDPRYKDFPFAPLTAAIVPFLANRLAVSRLTSEQVTSHLTQERGKAEVAAASVLLLCVIYIVPNEGLMNWQSLWLCAVFIALAIGLTRQQAAQDLR